MPGAISCIEWIPKGIADPNPKRYELSQREKELIDSYQEIEKEGGNLPPLMDGDDGIDVMEAINESDEESGDAATSDAGTSLPNTTSSTEGKEKSAAEKIAEQTIDPSTLPAELRMDDYSDDEGDNEPSMPIIASKNLDELVIENHLEENSDEEEEEEETADENMDGEEEEDVEIDGKEFMPTDIKGLEAMQFVDYDEEELEEDDDSDIEDTNLQEDDALLIVAKAQEDFASLEINVYENKTGNLFVHHDILLPAYPLCLAHGTIGGTGQAGNFVAVGSFNPGIEIWNLDVLDNLEPTCILGGNDTSDADNEWSQQMMSSTSSGGKKRKGKKKSKPSRSTPRLRQGSHTDAVMSLSWNQTHRQVLASGSADNTVKIWDVTRSYDATTGGVATTFTHHTDKVEAIAWHPTEGSILASGSYDRTVHLVDARSPDSAANRKKVLIPADCEALAWDPHNPHLLTSATEDGSVSCWDVRKFESGMTYWNFVAHEFGVSDISYNQNIPGMLATASVDNTVALWDTHNVSTYPDERPYPCGSKEMKVGKLYTVSFYPSLPWLLGCGGSGNELALWNLSDDHKNRFGERIGAKASGDLSPPVNNDNMFDSIIKPSNTGAEVSGQKQTKKKKKKGSSSGKKVHKRR